MLEMSTKRSGYRCTPCNMPFHANSPINCLVEVWAAFSMSLRCPRCGSSEVSMGLSLTAEENRARIGIGNIQARAEHWRIHGETGLSALTIFRHFMSIPNPHPAHPHDPDDLRRCLYLLEHIPEWAPRMPEIANASPTWARIADHWDELARQFREETSGGKNRAPLTYDLLKSLTDPQKHSSNGALPDSSR